MDRINNSSQGNPSRKLIPISIENQRSEHTPPPPPDESYWSALLREGEMAAGGGQRQIGTDWESFEGVAPAASTSNFGQDHHEWDIVQQTYDNDQTIELPVIGYNRGGLLVEWGSLRGFVPASQLVDFPSVAESAARRGELIARIGQHLT